MRNMMKAVIFNEYGGREVLRYADVERPGVRPGQVLIRVQAIGVNPADYKWRQGMFVRRYPVTLPHIVGYDVAGVVEQSDALPVGTRVCAVLPSVRKGGYAEYVAVAIERVSIMPDSLSFAEAAAIPSPGLTGVQMIEEHLDIQPGQRVLISGATGAVGRFVMHAAKLRGATIVAAVRAAYRDEALAMGADEVVVPEDPYVPETDAIADCVGGEWITRLGGGLRKGGLILTVATTPIPAETLPVEPVFIVIHPDRERLAGLMAAVGRKEVVLPKIHEWPLAEAGEVHRRLEHENGTGKFILVP